MDAMNNLKSQAGIMLLEAMIAILIFSFGILAVVGMQAHAVQDMGQAKFRSDASFLANQVIADIWTNAPKASEYEWTSGAPPALVTNWADQVYATLPGSQDNHPTIEYDAATRQITVTLRWLTPAEKSVDSSMAPHKFTAITYVNINS